MRFCACQSTPTERLFKLGVTSYVAVCSLCFATTAAHPFAADDSHEGAFVQVLRSAATRRRVPRLEKHRRVARDGQICLRCKPKRNWARDQTRASLKRQGAQYGRQDGASVRCACGFATDRDGVRAIVQPNAIDDVRFRNRREQCADHRLLPCEQATPKDVTLHEHGRGDARLQRDSLLHVAIPARGRQRQQHPRPSRARSAQICPPSLRREDNTAASFCARVDGGAGGGGGADLSTPCASRKRTMRLAVAASLVSIVSAHASNRHAAVVRAKTIGQINPNGGARQLSASGPALLFCRQLSLWQWCQQCSQSRRVAQCSLVWAQARAIGGDMGPPRVARGRVRRTPIAPSWQ